MATTRRRGDAKKKAPGAGPKKLVLRKETLKDLTLPGGNLKGGASGSGGVVSRTKFMTSSSVNTGASTG
jgi:hypothetical protein